MLIVGTTILGIWLLAMCTLIYETTDIQVDYVGRDRNNFGGGSTFIRRTRCRGHKLAKAACDGPDDRWKNGDLLIYSPELHYRVNQYYLFRKYEPRNLNPFHPTVLIYKCIECEPCRRPVFEENLGSEFHCIGELRGIQVNGKNVMFS